MPRRRMALITSEQMKAARGLLRWEQRDLAGKSGVSLTSIKRLEKHPGHLSAHNATIVAIVEAFATGGVEFIFGEQPGVRLKTRKAS